MVATLGSRCGLRATSSSRSAGSGTFAARAWVRCLVVRSARRRRDDRRCECAPVVHPRPDRRDQRCRWFSPATGGLRPLVAARVHGRSAALGRVAAIAAPSAVGASVRPLGLVIIAGLLVGVGTRVGSGCTSGHGVCGLSRLSARSAVAVAVFMSTGALTALLAGGLS